ncbi:hypothetical protein SBRY_40807 [Actinacidiphila bryophytorum]|uniref:Uncharacterized protein n=1 Tax=Actinacidiphila bryophytorum TaxID=1436133 RepID=A0A9W4H3B5_9ACTN|nr:hypothetical protein SBRY_40807 [Actinacidiphila bryophytorum]
MDRRLDRLAGRRRPRGRAVGVDDRRGGVLADRAARAARRRRGDGPHARRGACGARPLAEGLPAAGADRARHPAHRGGRRRPLARTGLDARPPRLPDDHRAAAHPLRRPRGPHGADLDHGRGDPRDRHRAGRHARRPRPDHAHRGHRGRRPDRDRPRAPAQGPRLGPDAHAAARRPGQRRPHRRPGRHRRGPRAVRGAGLAGTRTHGERPLRRHPLTRRTGAGLRRPAPPM